MDDFDRFSPALFSFLRELRENNDREWFKANQATYEEQVREPARAFIRAMKPRLKDVSRTLLVDDRKVGGSLMRIHRDVRFSKDKSPYKRNLGMQFRHMAGKDVHAPGLYVHLAPDDVFLGFGVYGPPSDALRAIREAIVEHPDAYRAALALPLSEGQHLGGSSLTRAPRGFDKDHPLVDDLKRKSFILVENLTEKQATRRDFPDRVASFAQRGRDFGSFLCSAVGLPF